MIGRYLSATGLILVVNIVVFVVTSSELWAGFSSLYLYFPQHSQFQVWQFVSYLFVHTSIWHLMFNMLALWIFGRELERQWGIRKFIIFYLMTGVGAATVYMAVNSLQFHYAMEAAMQYGISTERLYTMLFAEQYMPTVPDTKQAVRIFSSSMAGASGAIYGILVAFAWLQPRAKLKLLFFPMPVAAMYFVPLLIAFDLLAGIIGVSLFGAHVAHFAHVGGAMVGAVLIFSWRWDLALQRINR